MENRQQQDTDHREGRIKHGCGGYRVEPRTRIAPSTGIE
jgi:hypothetical protein